eukprot:2757082-Rhodomonas_salina.1
MNDTQPQSLSASTGRSSTSTVRRSVALLPALALAVLRHSASTLLDTCRASATVRACAAIVRSPLSLKAYRRARLMRPPSNRRNRTPQLPHT